MKTKSILTDDYSCCYLCGRTQWLEEHHIFGGYADRKISDKNGFVVPLCHWCHNEPPKGVHHCRGTALKLKRECQAKYEETHTREEFMRLIGRNYLDWEE